MKLKIVQESYLDGKTRFIIKKFHKFLWITWWSNLFDYHGIQIRFTTYDEAYRYCIDRIGLIKYSCAYGIFEYDEK
jgi:hypothetical protein